MQMLARASACKVRFELVDLTMPARTKQKFGEAVLPKYLGYSLGYRGMCRFFSGVGVVCVGGCVVGVGVLWVGVMSWCGCYVCLCGCVILFSFSFLHVCSGCGFVVGVHTCVCAYVCVCIRVCVHTSGCHHGGRR